MKTVEQLEIDRAYCLRKYEDHRTKRECRLTPEEVSQLKTKMKLLEKVRNYMETSPTEAFIKSEKKRLTSEVKRVETDFQKWKDAGGNEQIVEDLRTEEDREAALLKEWRKLNNYQQKKNQIKVLNFILG